MPATLNAPFPNDAAANRALLNRWRHYRLRDGEAPPIIRNDPHDALAACALRAIGYTHHNNELTPRGEFAMVTEQQPLIEIVACSPAIVFFRVIVAPRALTPLFGVRPSRIGSAWLAAQMAMCLGSTPRARRRWRMAARRFLRAPAIRDKVVAKMRRLPSLPFKRFRPEGFPVYVFIP